MKKQQAASLQVGVWIDHREAFLVFRDEPVTKGNTVVSGIEKHVRYSGHATAAEGLAEDQRDRRFEHHLERYYDDVIAQLQHATSIFIFGPGEAKDEFRRRLEHKHLGTCIAGFETADKLTNPQRVAKVQLFFQHRV